MQLVDEGDDLAGGVLDLVEDSLQPLLELTTVFRAGDHRRQIEGNHPASLQRIGHITGNNTLSEALDDGRLADAGFADQHRVVLGTTAQHLDDAPDLRVASDHRVELALTSTRRQVDRILVEC
ncbi:hypothetical protein SDC9_177686 [bioreactor metagenome]|uniref:Uncharacterized protein n=1 Tax=bioreactor metagenome TaxID=1076179 RepID=A0A645H303_9ZZZZ